jgi:hypothetical protein
MLDRNLTNAPQLFIYGVWRMIIKINLKIFLTSALVVLATSVAQKTKGMDSTTEYLDKKSPGTPCNIQLGTVSVTTEECDTSMVLTAPCTGISLLGTYATNLKGANFHFVAPLIGGIIGLIFALPLVDAGMPTHIPQPTWTRTPHPTPTRLPIEPYDPIGDHVGWELAGILSLVVVGIGATFALFLFMDRMGCFAFANSPVRIVGSDTFGDPEDLRPTVYSPRLVWRYPNEK